MPLKYLSGEEIRKGDRVIFHGEPGDIEFVVDGFVGDQEIDWHMSKTVGLTRVHAAIYSAVY